MRPSNNARGQLRTERLFLDVGQSGDKGGEERASVCVIDEVATKARIKKTTISIRNATPMRRMSGRFS